MSDQRNYDDLVNRLADQQNRNETIIALVGAINARDLAKVKVSSKGKESAY